MTRLTRETVDTGLSFDDVLLVPQYSPIDSRSDVDLQTRVAGDVTIDLPIISAAMDTVTEAEMAIALGKLGGLGCLHRFMSVEEQARQCRMVKEENVPVSAAIGINEDVYKRSSALVDAGVDVLMLDVAHGHMQRVIDAVDNVKPWFPDTPLIAGNVVTESAIYDLADKGVDGVKIGIGPGSHCTTRKKAGAGMPQLTAISIAREVSDELVGDLTVIADGGIRNSGDAAKALAAGADSVMMGGFFGGMKESPGRVVEIEDENGDVQKVKKTRGMATKAAVEDRDDKNPDTIHEADEGVEGYTEYTGEVQPHVEEFVAGIRSGISYTGAGTIQEAHERAEFIGIDSGTEKRNGAH